MIAAIFGAEFTNPFLQLRWFLRSVEKHKTWYGELNDILFMFLFTLMRLGIGSNLLYTYLRNPKPDLLVKFCAVMFWLIGLAFWVMIVNYAIKKYKKMYRLYKNGDLWKHNKQKTNNNASLLAQDGKEEMSSSEMNGHINGTHNGNTSHSKDKDA